MTVDLVPLTREALRSYIADRVFPLQPSDYRLQHPAWPGAVGLELEMLLLEKNTGHGLQLATGVAAQLRRAAAREGWKVEDLGDAPQGERLLGSAELHDGARLTFEPGEQLEISTKPFPCLEQAVESLRKAQTCLDQEFAASGTEIVQIGLNPWFDPEQVGLRFAKARYRAMDAYFRQIGPDGARMMRTTCTVQVNLDFGASEHTLAKRYLGASLMAPMIAGMFAHSPFRTGRPASLVGQRSSIWLHLDPSRTGILPLDKVCQRLDKASCVELYEDFALNAQVIFVEELGYEVPAKPLTFRHWLEHGYKKTFPTAQDLQTHLSLLFPEVRPRGFLELRSADCQSRVWQTVPAALWTALLYDDVTLDKTIEFLLPHRSRLKELAQQAVHGLQDDHLWKLARQLMVFATQGLALLPSCYQPGGIRKALEAYQEHFVERQRTPANDLVDECTKQQKTAVDLEVIRSVEETWRQRTA